jgi:hypothetical protein
VTSDLALLRILSENPLLTVAECRRIARREERRRRVQVRAEVVEYLRQTDSVTRKNLDSVRFGK